MPDFKLRSDYVPKGDQPEAIDALVEGIQKGMKDQVLLGVTGSGKTFTIANVVEKLNRPTLVISHNKTLAASWLPSSRPFFRNNAVEYFVSYYDYYQPEAYVPQSDTYIEKDATINDEIDKLRHSATFALFERRDVLVVASVSCIYGLGSPEDYRDLVLSLQKRDGEGQAEHLAAPGGHPVHPERHRLPAGHLSGKRATLSRYIRPEQPTKPFEWSFSATRSRGSLSLRSSHGQAPGRDEPRSRISGKALCGDRREDAAGGNVHRGRAGRAAQRTEGRRKDP
jgi:hypothetical protein